MVSFLGRYSAKLDDKGRLILPAAFKAALGNEDSLRFVLRKSISGKCLEMYPMGEWEKVKDNLKNRLDPFNPEHRLIWRSYLQGAAPVDAENKLGRISIPRHLLDLVGIEKDVVFSGVDDFIEVWSKKNFDEQVSCEDDFPALVKSVTL